ncbi:hypothetical protein SAMN05443549_105273 [Flavobacterium fluvii]|uniref:Uncharacterized protein n=1 Tax=Flavobacterium fluvii TaxID=468056 RepID=A0A1M5LMP3_9FLAO|nr:hypothetical protein [Flavobacterium fluvii]SHG66412.1 hypothetical protein SAMN05443549_105273 [Flavobacterium fluvii]
MMMNTQYPYKDKLTKWFLAVTLLLGIFAFSGYANNLQSRQLQTTQTELVVSNNHKICKRAISYKKGIELSLFISPQNSFDKNWANALITHNLLTKVKLDTISRQFYSHKPANLFLQVKTIPQSSDEDIFATYIG